MGTPDDSVEGEVSEVNRRPERADEPIGDADMIAGDPADDPDRADLPDVGTAGPDAPPRHGVPEESNESSR